MQRFLLASVMLLWASAAFAQGSVQQLGPVVSGHIPMWNSNGRIMDGGGSPGAGQQPANNTNAGTLPTGLAVVNSGLGYCDYSAYASATYNSLCWGFDGSGNGLIDLEGPNATFSIKINGTTYPFPGTGTGNVVGPVSTTVGHAALWANTAGSLLSDGGQPPSFAPGVVADGVIGATTGTDNTAALQAIANGITKGQLVLLPPGVIKVTSTVTWPVGATVCGAGSPGYNNTNADYAGAGLKGTIVQTTSGSGDVFQTTGEDRFLFCNFAFDYSGASPRSGGAYINFVGNFITPGSGTVQRMPEVNAVQFRKGYVDIQEGFVAQPRVINTAHEDFAFAGIYIVENATGADYGDGVFEGNLFTELNISAGTCTAGILNLATGLTTVTANKFNGCKYGWDLELTYGPTGTALVRGNSFENQTNTAILMNQASSGIDYGSVTIADNEFLSFANQFPANGLIRIAAGTSSAPDTPNWIWRVNIHDNHMYAPYTSAAPLISLQDGGGVTVHDNICDLILASSGPPCITVGGNAGGSASGFVALLNNMPVRYGSNIFYGPIKDGTVIKDIIYTTGNSLGTTTEPTITSCGTSPTVSGTDQLFQITVGSGGPVTACTATLGVKPAVTPLCVITGQASGALVFSYAQSIVAGKQVITVNSSADMTGAAVTVSCSP